MFKWSLSLLALLLPLLCLSQVPAKIKVGDVLRMTCEEEPTLNKQYTVTDQGMILVDFLGAVHVEGNTEAEAARIVSSRLVDGRILRKATVTLKIVSTSVAPVTYRGAVRQTGQIPHREGLRLSDVVEAAGARDDTDLARVEVRRRNGDISFVDFTKDNPELQPGDTVTFLVKTAPGLVVVLGGVARPGGVEWQKGMTVRGAIEKAGGFAALAVTTAVRLEREGQPPQTLDLSGDQQGPEVREGDRIVVGVRENRLYVTVSGAVANGGFIEFRPGMTLTQAIEAAGGLRADAKAGAIRLTRNGQSQATQHDFAAIRAGRATDPVLNSGDKVMVDARVERKNELLKSLTMLALLYILLGR
jgi:polysaccharide export outer membrane protein